MDFSTNKVYLGDAKRLLESLPEGCINLCYVDPPFGTNKVQKKTTVDVTQDSKGDRTGFAGKRYRTKTLGTISYSDVFSDYCAWIEPYLREIYRVLHPSGSFLLHLDWREVHYVKIMLDVIFGRENFKNEIIWAYDYGARSKSKWSTKHDTILWYVKNKGSYTFNYDELDRIPYMAPSLVGEEKAARGKTPTDVLWHTIVPTNGKEKTGYPTQKPLGLLRQFVRVHSNPGDTLLDFMAGSGTLGACAQEFNRRFILCDSSQDAIDVIKKRLGKSPVEYLTL